MEALASLDTGGGASVTSAVRKGAREGDASICGEGVGDGDDASGFAMRRPPKDCERLRSLSMALVRGARFDVDVDVVSE